MPCCGLYLAEYVIAEQPEERPVGSRQASPGAARKVADEDPVGLGRLVRGAVATPQDQEE